MASDHSKSKLFSLPLKLPIIQNLYEKKHKFACSQLRIIPNRISLFCLQVLNEMKPGLDYRVVSEGTNKLRPSFTIAVTIDDVEYEASARSKKVCAFLLLLQLREIVKGLLGSIS